jgi:hypothetical protein
MMVNCINSERPEMQILNPLRSFALTTKAIVWLLILLLTCITSAGVTAQDNPLPLPRGTSREFAPEGQLAATPSQAASLFGFSVALDGDYMAVGARDYNGTGAVFIFERDQAGVWTQQVMLTASDTAAGDEFGFSVALEGSTLMVGARKQGPDDKGAVYVFVNSGGIWSQQARLQPTLNNFAYFGRQIALDGSRVVIAASGIGAAYIYQRDTLGQWNYEVKLPTTLFDTYAVAIDGTRVAVSTLTEDNYAGAVYLYELVSGVWTETAHLTATGGIDYDYFGNALALDGNRLLIGAALADFTGAVYSFELNAGVWTEQQTLGAGDGAPSNLFGSALALEGDVLMIGTPFDDAGLGSVYRFDWNGTDWIQEHKIEIVGGQFGHSLDLQNNTLVVGAPEAVSGGRVHIYVDAGLEPIELLVDGSFEANAAGWEIKNPTGDKVKCDNPPKNFAYEGNCAWRFKGVPGENAKIQQVITTGVNSGDTLILRGYVNSTAVADSKVKFIIKYVDTSLPKHKLTVDVLGQTSGYIPLSVLQSSMTVTVTAPIDKIKVMVKNSGESGKIYYDALSLTAQ